MKTKMKKSSFLISFFLAAQFACSLNAQNELYRPNVQSREVKTIQTKLPLHSYKASESSTVQVEVVGGIAIIEGDIKLGKIELITAGMGVVAIDGSKYRWPGGQIPFAISNTFAASRIVEINEAVQELNLKTNLYIYPRTAESDYITFVPSTGCSSPVGRQGGNQEIDLADGCGKGSIMHEILHSAGLYHEQSRGDRNGHVEILWDNIQEGKKHNFEQHSGTASDIGSYDYASIMHYGGTAFGKVVSGTVQQTIKCKASCPTLGNRSRLSDLDISGVNSIYPSEASKPWLLINGSSGADIAVDESGIGYMTNTVGKIYRYNGSSWQQLSGSAGKSIASNGGKVCMVNTTGKIYQLNGAQWQQLSGSAANDIAIDQDGTIWMTNTAGKIYRHNGNSWDQVPGSDASRIAAGGGQVWMINTAGKIYRYNSSGNKFDVMAGSAGKDITVGNDGSIWLTNSGGGIYKWNGAGWSQIFGSDGKTISANNGKAFMVNTAGKLYLLAY
jgi:streptogramin lyase